MKNYWASKAWKGAVLVILSAEESNSQRSKAFRYMKRKFTGFYSLFAIKYATLLSNECEHVESFLDEKLWDVLRKFDLEKDNLKSYFINAANNAMKDIFRKRASRMRAGYVPILLEGLNENEIKNIKGKEVVEHDLIAAIGENLSPIQQEVLSLRLTGTTEKIIRKKLHLSYWDIKKILRSIGVAAQEAMEV